MYALLKTFAKVVDEVLNVLMVVMRSKPLSLKTSSLKALKLVVIVGLDQSTT